MIYDVAVIGAGPVGSFLAKQLADEDLSVLLLEEHEVVGLPVHCTGVIGASSYRKFNLPKESIQNKIPDINFISPKGYNVSLNNPTHWAYIVCRHKFDRSLARVAEEGGVKLLLQSKVTDLKEDKRGVTLNVEDGREFKARFAVIATGSTSKLPYNLGFYRPWYFLKSAQIETEVDFDDPKSVDVFLGTKVSGGEFIWIVPVNETRARIGVFSRYNANQYLKTFLDRQDIKERISNSYEISRSVIPIGGLDEKAVQHTRIFTVGDAAGHVKPTSAGGIIFGMTCAQLLTKSIMAYQDNSRIDLNLARTYYQKVRRKLGLEILMGNFFRSLFSKLEDGDWDEIVELANNPDLYELIQKKSEFDKHSKIIRWVLTNKNYRRIFFQRSKKELLPVIKKGMTIWI